MPASKIDEAEQALSRCRKVSTGDIIMPDDVNCLVDAANSSVSAIRYALNEIYARVATIDPEDFYVRRYSQYRYENTGALMLLEEQYMYYRTSYGALLLDGEGADQVEVEVVKASEDVCEPGWEVMVAMLLGKNTIKTGVVKTAQTNTFKFTDLSTLLLLVPRYVVSTGVTSGHIAVVRDAISVRLYKGGSLIKDYSIDVIGQLCGDEYCYYRDRCFYWSSHCVYIEPENPERWYFVEVEDVYWGTSLSCISALDSTDINSAEVLASNCTYDGAPHMYLPAGTKMITYFTISSPKIRWGVGAYDIQIMPFPRPDLVPDEEGDSLYCGYTYVPIR
ncbi:MAG: hypothetical protein QW512_04245 [Thermofilaceae archaeon]